MKKYLQISIFSAVIILIFNSCYKSDDYSAIPKIELLSYDKVNQGQDIDSFYFTVSYIDGDGDLGLDQEDTLPPFDSESPYNKNFYIEYYEKVNGQFKRVKPLLNPNIDTIGFNYRFPVLSSSIKPKTIKGEITVGILHNIPPVYSKNIKYKMYIYDRKLHKSNVIETPEIQR